MVAVILAGGKGTRLHGICSDCPKPMVSICGKPVLQHQIETLKREGVREFILAVGYLADQIVTFFGDGKRFGVKISYFYEKEPLGTAGALFQMELQEDFLLCNGDLIFDFSLQRMVEFHKSRHALATLFAHPNRHPDSSTLLDVDDDSRILGFSLPGSRTAFYANLCAAGIYILSPRLFCKGAVQGFAQLDRDVLIPAAATGGLFAYRSAEYVRDMGMPELLACVERDVQAGIPAKRNLTNAQRAVFLDRDGTVNRYRGYISSPEQIELLPGVASAIKRINELGYLAILATNQPVVARGACSLDGLRTIHKKIETLLGKEGAFLDAIYFCPHHPDGGFAGENPAYKIQCACRKPAPGMLLEAAQAFHIDLSASYMVGDSMRDVQTAINAGCFPVLLRSGSEEPSGLALPNNIRICDSLKAFAMELPVI